jgi:pimeloyl-ACP methyl ester carboxylesterase
MNNYLPIFKDDESKNRYYDLYDRILSKWPTQIESTNISTNYGDTHVNICGPKDAQPVILLPGNYSSSTIWTQCIPSLIKNYRIFSIDTIGEVGRSQPTRIPHSRTDYNEWLLDILDKLKLKAPSFLGISYGGFLSINFAISYPERVNKLALLCPGIMLAPIGINWAIMGLPMMISSSKSAVYWFLKGASTKKDIITDPEIELFILGITNLKSKNVLQPKISDYELRSITNYVMVLIGDSEILYNSSAAITKAKKIFKHVEAEIIPKSGHFITFDQPVLAMSKVNSFISK